MKPQKRYKSLLPGSGLLLICLISLRMDQVRLNKRPDPVETGKHMVNVKGAVDPDGCSYIKTIAGKLFPVLKNLNLM